MTVKMKQVFTPVLKPIFIGFITIYVGLLIVKQTNIAIPKIVSAYLADLLCLPILLTLTLVSLRLFFQNDSFILSRTKIFVAFLYVSLLFELFLPYFSSAYTADPFDVVAYAIGSVIYLLTQST